MGRNRTFCIYVHSARRAIVKLDDRTTMCFFVGYKYEGGGYQVWDPKRRVVVESRYLVFAYRRPHSTIRVHSQLTTRSRLYSPHLTTPHHTTELPTLPTLPAVSDAPAPILPFTASPEATHEYGPTTTPHPSITMRLPGRWMKRPAMEYRDKSDEYDGPEDEATRQILYVPDYPMRLTVAPCSFSMRQRILLSCFRPVYLALADPAMYARAPTLANGREQCTGR